MLHDMAAHGDLPMRNIAVYIRSMRFLGGQIVTWPLLYALHKHWPDSHVRIVARDAVAHQYACLPWPVEFVHAQGFWGLLGGMRRRTDMMLALHYSSERYGLFAAIRRPKLRLGFQNSRMLDRVWTHAWPKDFDEYLGLANMRLLARVLPVDIEANARECFQAIAATSLASDAQTDVVMMPGGGAGHYKRWSLDNYLSVLQMMRARFGQHLSFAFVLGPDEQSEHDRLQALNLPGVSVLMSRPLADIARICLGARLVVANDCGPSHIAQGACVPYVGIINEPNPQWFWARPYARCVTPAGADSGNIHSIAPEQVMSACEALWTLNRAESASTLH